MKLESRMALLLAATMVLSSTPTTVWASDYEQHWAAEAITRWKDKGIIDDLRMELLDHKKPLQKLSLQRY